MSEIRMNAMRKSSEVENNGFPFTDVTYTVIHEDGEMEFCNNPLTKTNRRYLVELMSEPNTQKKFIACWEGRWKNDMFIIDDLAQAVEKLKC